MESSFEIFYQKGNESFKADNLLEAITSYSKALEADPNNESTYKVLRNRGLCFFKLDRHKECKRDAKATIHACPSWFKGHVLLCWARLGLNQPNKAEQAIREGLELVPESERHFLTEELEKIRNSQLPQEPQGAYLRCILLRGFPDWRSHDPTNPEQHFYQASCHPVDSSLVSDMLARRNHWLTHEFLDRKRFPDFPCTLVCKNGAGPENRFGMAFSGGNPVWGNAYLIRKSADTRHEPINFDLDEFEKRWGVLKISKSRGKLVFNLSPIPASGGEPSTKKVQGMGLVFGDSGHESKSCSRCGVMGEASKPLKRCSGCNNVWYCSAECQKVDWKAHKLLCGKRRWDNSFDRCTDLISRVSQNVSFNYTEGLVDWSRRVFHMTRERGYIRMQFGSVEDLEHFVVKNKCRNQDRDVSLEFEIPKEEALLASLVKTMDPDWECVVAMHFPGNKVEILKLRRE